jgi:hypothetical protein
LRLTAISTVGSRGEFRAWARGWPERQVASGGTTRNATGTIAGLGIGGLALVDSQDFREAARIDIETGETTLIAEHDKADIGQVFLHRDTREPTAYSIMRERREYFAIDPRVQADLDFLADQRLGDWFILNRSEDERFWVIGSDADDHAPTDYLYDREAKSFRLLHHGFPELANAPLSPMQPLKLPGSRDRTHHTLCSQFYSNWCRKWRARQDETGHRYVIVAPIVRPAKGREETWLPSSSILIPASKWLCQRFPVIWTFHVTSSLYRCAGHEAGSFFKD